MLEYEAAILKTRFGTHEKTGTLSTGNDQVRDRVHWGRFYYDRHAAVYERSR